MNLKTLLREPLAQFALVAILVFAYARLRASNEAPPKPSQKREISYTIPISSAEAERIKASLAKSLGRPPKPEEMDVQIKRRFREEALVREATRLGIHRSDMVVRRRLVQAMEALADSSFRKKPTDAELTAYLKSHAGEFQVPARISFEHVYFGPAGRKGASKEAEAAAKKALKKLAKDPNAKIKADPFARGPSFAVKSQKQLLSIFGQSFGRSLFAKAAKDTKATASKKGPASKNGSEWFGPLRSSYGFHLVKVRVFTPARAAKLAEVKKAVSTRWSNNARKAHRKQLLDQWVSRYKPAKPTAPTAAASAKP